MGIINLSHVRAAHEAFLNAHKAMVAGVLYDAGNIVSAEIALRPQFTPHTGKLQRATKTRVIRTAGGRLLRVTNSSPYAAPIELGSRPHRIVARNARVLRFYTKNGVVFRRAVNHPGTKPYWFMRKATDVAGHRAEHMLLAGMERVARRFGS